MTAVIVLVVSGVLAAVSGSLAATPNWIGVAGSAAGSLIAARMTRPRPLLAAAAAIAAGLLATAAGYYLRFGARHFAAQGLLVWYGPLREVLRTSLVTGALEAVAVACFLTAAMTHAGTGRIAPGAA